MPTLVLPTEDTKPKYTYTYVLCAWCCCSVLDLADLHSNPSCQWMISSVIPCTQVNLEEKTASRNSNPK